MASFVATGPLHGLRPLLNRLAFVLKSVVHRTTPSNFEQPTRHPMSAFWILHVR